VSAVPETDRPIPAASRLASTLLRAAALFGLWLVVAGTDPLGLGFGLLAAALGTWASRALLPPTGSRLSAPAMAGVIGGVLRESVAAGWDIARRALARDPRLAPCIVPVPLTLPRGPAQDGFRLLASLAPGALPLDSNAGTLRLHVLDTRMPHAEGLATTERAVAAALGTRT
jgi:multicomponent Na+:H+ antiporter subunit E